MTLKAILYFLLAISTVFFTTACRLGADSNRVVSKDSTYFSMKQFEVDQAQLYGGTPLSLYRIAYLDDKKDTTIVNFMNMDWASIFRTFSAADISDPKFIGHYVFNAFDDETTGSRSYVYTAADAKQFTRLLQINTDPSNDRITSLYIETAKHSFLGSTTQKLLYVPLHIIQIQESVHNLIGPTRNLRIDYRFMQPEEVVQQ
jgi:hypothetical protein